MALPTSAEQARKTLIIRTEDELKAFRATEGEQEEQEGEQNEHEEQDDEDEDENLTAEECRLQKEFADEQRFQFSRIVSATRLHLPPEAEEIPEATADHLRKYVSQAKMLGVVAAIAVNGHVDEVSRIAEETEPGFKVNILHVPCWGAFVPALNALLNFAQGKGKKYILYQSLEVCCARDVLQRLLDHHTADTLVVGPVVDGHVFCDGEQPLNGRSSPWNTLALWSVRKLALTGFLCIADGLPDVPPSVSRETSMAFADELNPQDSGSSPMGSDGWWSHSEGASGPFGRQQSAPVASVPAGVEEVTAIALLQHLHGSDRSRAVLVKLPPHLEAKMSWAASWGQDEKRKKWHKYKMASKVSRPAAQLQELFKFQKSGSAQSLGEMVADAVSEQGGGSSGSTDMAGTVRRRVGGGCLQRRRSSKETEEVGAEVVDTSAASPVGAEEVGEDGPGGVGKVMHYGESIPPPPGVKWMCLAMCLLFYANSTAVLSTAFRHMNDAGAGSQSTVSFVALLMGGVYLPMPLSLWLTRTAVKRYSHIAGLLLFLGFLLLGHLIMVIGQVLIPNAWWPLLLARLVHGLGSGILFQTRHILATMSTSDQHVSLQTWNFEISDLGLGFGAIFPAATHHILAAANLWKPEAPELMPSLVFSLISLGCGVWVLVSFPRRPFALPERVRFSGGNGKDRRRISSGDDDRKFRYTTWLSGTTRIFVQSAIVPVVGLSMRDAHWTGNYRQTFAVAAIFLLPLPFEVFASSLSSGCGFRSRAKDDTNFSKLLSGGVGAAALLIAGLQPRNVVGEEGEFLALITRICELGILMIALGMAAPFNASKLYQQKDAERSIVVLEWLKAYAGRLLGPFAAVLMYSYAGYGPVLCVLCIATALVTLTA